MLFVSLCGQGDGVVDPRYESDYVRSGSLDSEAEWTSSATRVCAEIRAIDSAVHRLKLQQSLLDFDTLRPFLDDHLLIDSMLTDAGISVPGDRLKILATLKSLRGRDVQDDQTEGPPANSQPKNFRSSSIRSSRASSLRLSVQRRASHVASSFPSRGRITARCMDHSCETRGISRIVSRDPSCSGDLSTTSL